MRVEREHNMFQEGVEPVHMHAHCSNCMSTRRCNHLNSTGLSKCSSCLMVNYCVCTLHRYRLVLAISDARPDHTSPKNAKGPIGKITKNNVNSRQRKGSVSGLRLGSQKHGPTSCLGWSTTTRISRIALWLHSLNNRKLLRRMFSLSA